MRIAPNFALILTLTLLSTMLQAASYPPTCNGIDGFFRGDLQHYQDRVDDTNRDYQNEDWLVETADPKASSSRLADLFEASQKASYDVGILQSAQALDNATAQLDVGHCPMKVKLSRARYLLESSILSDAAVIAQEKKNQQLQQELVNRSNAFRISIPGEKEPISRALYRKLLESNSNREQRKQLYLRFNSARAEQWMKWGFRDLIKARNQEGKLSGYPSYVEYRYFRSQLDLPHYLSLVKQVKHHLAPKLRLAYQKLAERAGISRIEPWDMWYLEERAASGSLDDLLAQVPADGIFEFAKYFYSKLGISIDDEHLTMDLYPRPGKNGHAFEMGVVLPHIDDNGQILAMPKPDVRFFANLKQPVHWSDIRVVIHELGHAVHDSNIRQPLGIFRGTESVSTEAIAMTMERMASSSEFLSDAMTQFAGVSAAQVRSALLQQDFAQRFDQADLIVGQALLSEFEYEIYKSPDADYRAIWSKLYNEYYGVTIPLSKANWDVEGYLMTPVVVQNYGIGVLMAEQLYASMLADFHTSYDSTDLGDKLKKVYFSGGKELNYLDLVKSFTGKPLSAEDAMKLLD